MSNNVSSAPGYIDANRATQLLEKWAPMLDFSSDKVAPIESEHQRLATAMLMENQEKWCINEAGNTASGGVFGAGGSSSGYAVGQYGGAQSASDWYAKGDSRMPKVLIPMVRRTFPELITNEIVGVQPMSGPVGLAFALRYKYENSALGTNGIDGVDAPGAGVNRANAAGGFIPRVAGTVSQSGIPGAADGELGYQYLDTRFTGTSAAWIKGNAGEAGLVAGEAVTINDEDTGIAAILSQYELTGNIPQVTVEFSKTAVEAGTRRLAARWSIELEQDLKNMNGLDIDSELTNAMSYEIQAEIDREMIIRMLQISLNAGKGTGYSFWYAASADARWLGERNRDFYSKVIVEANRIAIRNRRGSANFIIATPKVCAIMEMLPEFQWMPVNGNVNTQPTGIAKVGTLGGRFTIYRDTRTEAQNLTSRKANGTVLEYALLGYKGTEYYDTGIVYCPYIPVMIQRTVGPTDFSPRVGLMTRYGVVDYIFGASLYYHTIIVKGLGSDNVNGNGGKLYM